MRGMHTLPNVDVKYLDAVFFDRRGNIRILPHSEVARIPIEHIQVWCVLNAVYTLPTQELIDWLQQQVNERKAIEICAGNGSIGRALGIPRTDSYCQTSLPELRMYYAAFGQKVTEPPKDVEKFEALDAIAHYHPKVVISSFGTQIYMPGDEIQQVGSNVYGVDELKIISVVNCYIHIGNDGPHKDKRIYKFNHRKLRFPWLVTRAQNQDLNNISIWGA